MQMYFWCNEVDCVIRRLLFVLIELYGPEDESASEAPILSLVAGDLQGVQLIF